MRAPSPSLEEFKAELSAELNACRKWLGTVPLHPDHYQLAMKILDRWEERDIEAKEIWDTIRKKIPDMKFSWLIDATLHRRLGIVEKLKARIPEMPEVEAEVRRHATHRRRVGERDQAKAEMSQLMQFRAQRKRILGRKMQSVPQREFKAGWGGIFTELCGEPLDNVAAFLTEVAFDGEVSIDATRQARRKKNPSP